MLILCACTCQLEDIRCSGRCTGSDTYGLMTSCGACHPFIKISADGEVASVGRSNPRDEWLLMKGNCNRPMVACRHWRHQENLLDQSGRFWMSFITNPCTSSRMILISQWLGAEACDILNHLGAHLSRA